VDDLKLDNLSTDNWYSAVCCKVKFSILM